MEGSENATSELDGAAAFLAYLLSTCRVLPDGTVVETRVQVARIDGVSIHVYHNEHSPPHFHVRCAEQKASFTIEDCNILKGSLGSRQNKIVKYWFESRGKSDLMEAWDRTRPGDCSVGRYRDAADA